MTKETNKKINKEPERCSHGNFGCHICGNGKPFVPLKELPPAGSGAGYNPPQEPMEWGNYHEIERILNEFKNGETYSTSIENIQNLIKQAEEREQKKAVEFMEAINQEGHFLIRQEVIKAYKIFTNLINQNNE